MKGKYTVESAKKKWKNLCDTHRRYVKKKKSVRSGSATKKKVKWMYYDQMRFMRDIQLVDKISVSNINMDDSEDNDEHDENEAPKGQASKRKKSRSKEEAIDRLADAISASPVVVFLHHLFCHHLYLRRMPLMHF